MRLHSRAVRLLSLLLPVLLLPSRGEASGGGPSESACMPAAQAVSSFQAVGSRISAIAAVGSTLLFSAHDGVNGLGLWKLSAEPGAAPVRVTSVPPPWSSTAPTVKRFSVLGQRLFFVVQLELDTELWVTDEAHTRVSMLASFPGTTLIDEAEYIVLGSTLFFTAADRSGLKLWRSQGTTVEAVVDEAGDPVSNPSGLAVLDGKLFFAAAHPQAGKELWTVGEAQQSATLFADVQPGSTSSSPGSLRVMGGKLYFTARTSAEGEELWVSTGVNGHAEPAVRSGKLGGAHGPLEALTVVGDKLFFHMSRTDTGDELWVSNGTEAGTRLVKEIRTGLDGGDPRRLTAVGRMLFFMADDGTAGREPWRSDGTEEGTFMVKEFIPGKDHAYEELLTAGPGVLLLSIHEPTVGQELWSLSGAEPLRLTDIASGSAGSFPHDMTLFGGALYFAAQGQGPGSGEELYSLPLNQVDCENPELECPSALRAEAVSPLGALVFLPPPKRMSDNSFTPLKVEYNPAPAAIFPLGTHTTATLAVVDAAGRRGECTLPVTVQDTIGPELVCPERLFEEATGPEGAPVSFPVVAREAVSGLRPLSYSHAPGSLFPLDTPVTVTVTATDGADNATECRFQVVVRDKVPPKLTCPRDVVHVATSAEPVPITYPAPRVEDAVSTPRLLEPELPSGSLFRLGETEVLLEAEDEARNRAQCRFSVYNVDAVAPTITCPAPQHVEATGPEGAVVSFPEAEAADALGPPEVRYSLASGSTLPVGETTVTATARDAGGNEASCSFTITVTAPEPPAGCGCRASAAGTSLSWLLLALAPLWARRRRERRTT